jgi:hypothetical protein
MIDKIATITDNLVSIFFISSIPLFFNQKAKSHPNWQIYGLSISTVNRIGLLGIVIFFDTD